MLFSFSTQAQVKVGDTLPTFTLLNVDDKKVSSTTFQDKFILIDFWASWCAPCRLGNRKLVKLYSTIDKNKLDIIGISLDTDKTKWLKAVAIDKIKFIKLTDPKGFEAKTAMQFGVDALPAKFLFNKK